VNQFYSGVLPIQYVVEIVIAIDVTLISAILIVDLLILKNNGWIGKTSNYRCPNPRCQKIFQKPLRVKNFLNKKEIRLACPECGYDLGSLKDERSLKEIALQSKPELKTKDSASTPTDAKVSKTNNGNKEPKALRTTSPIAESKQRGPQETNRSLILKQKMDAAKKDRSDGCSHYFGYLSALPKGTKTPDECYSCARLIECYKEAKD
jgi:hypothetical protein